MIVACVRIFMGRIFAGRTEMWQQLKLSNRGAQRLMRRLDHVFRELTCFVALRAAAGVVRGQLGSP